MMNFSKRRKEKRRQLAFLMLKGAERKKKRV
jgi:hypothetical protein